MYLLYINSLRRNFRGENIYEFIFGNTTSIEYGENWDTVPASAADYISPPPLEFIKEVGYLTTDEFELECIQDSDNFSILDAVDDIVALAFEREPREGKTRLVFHFGEKLQDVKDKLYTVDAELDFEHKVKYATTYEEK